MEFLWSDQKLSTLCGFWRLLIKFRSLLDKLTCCCCFILDTDWNFVCICIFMCGCNKTVRNWTSSLGPLDVMSLVVLANTRLLSYRQNIDKTTIMNQFSIQSKLCTNLQLQSNQQANRLLYLSGPWTGLSRKNSSWWNTTIRGFQRIKLFPQKNFQFV